MKSRPKVRLDNLASEMVNHAVYGDSNFQLVFCDDLRTRLNLMLAILNYSERFGHPVCEVEPMKLSLGLGSRIAICGSFDSLSIEGEVRVRKLKKEDVEP